MWKVPLVFFFICLPVFSSNKVLWKVPPTFLCICLPVFSGYVEGSPNSLYICLPIFSSNKVLWKVPPTFSPTPFALGSSAIVKGFFAANGFRLPKGSLECSPNNSLHLSHSLPRFFFLQMAVASEKVQWRFRQLFFTFVSQVAL